MNEELKNVQTLNDNQMNEYIKSQISGTNSVPANYKYLSAHLIS